MKIRIKRVYDAPSRADGYRVLADRLWPRGISKADAALDEWCKNVAPSNELRKWFGHDPDRWEEFRWRYVQELTDKRDDVIALIDRTSKKTMTLLYAARDVAHNNAMVLKEFIEATISD